LKKVSNFETNKTNTSSSSTQQQSKYSDMDLAILHPAKRKRGRKPNQPAVLESTTTDQPLSLQLIPNEESSQSQTAVQLNSQTVSSTNEKSNFFQGRMFSFHL
jgi:hypothetical protein